MKRLANDSTIFVRVYKQRISECRITFQQWRSDATEVRLKKSDNTFSYRDMKRRWVEWCPMGQCFRGHWWYCWQLIQIFTVVLDSQIPVKEKRVKKRDQPNWFTTEINEAMKKRDKLLKKARISESPVDWATFKRAKNEVCKLIRSAKEQYFKNNLLNINIILKDRGALSGI